MCVRAQKLRGGGMSADTHNSSVVGERAVAFLQVLPRQPSYGGRSEGAAGNN